MFLKVFKYDFKALIFKYLPVLAILPILAILVRLVNIMNINSSNGFILLMIIGANGLFLLGCSLILIYVLAICIIRYVKSLFKDQGYLTHTLPVTKHSLLLSHLLADFLMQIINFLMIGICLAIAYLTPNLWDTILVFVEQMFKIVVTEEEILRMFSGTFVLLLFCMLFYPFQNLFIIYTGVAIGHAFAKNKGILSVVFCIVLNYAIGIGTTIVTSFYWMLSGWFRVDNSQDSIGILNGFLGITLFISIVICVVGYFLDIYLMKKRLNLE